MAEPLREPLAAQQRGKEIDEADVPGFRCLRAGRCTGARKKKYLGSDSRKNLAEAKA